MQLAPLVKVYTGSRSCGGTYSRSSRAPLTSVMSSQPMKPAYALSTSPLFWPAEQCRPLTWSRPVSTPGPITSVPPSTSTR